MVFIEVFKTNHDYKFFIYFYSTFSQIWLIPIERATNKSFRNNRKHKVATHILIQDPELVGCFFMVL